MDSKQIRQRFLNYFAKKGHKIVPSAPIVVKNDPTLMFTNAGMNQFKDYFLGTKVPEVRRIADTQKCLRVSGKHNDLEEVGTDGYHHTMFEMLGNWSFGDYFKKEAIQMAWQLLTEEYRLPKDRLFISVFGGDESEGLDRDMEAVRFWREWVDEDRILFFGKKDNFWEMGDTGPCGPCSEIHIDLRSEDEIKRNPGAPLVNAGTPDVMEIWNLVFIQFNRKADGSLEELPEKHIDTGMGFERLSMVLQNKKASYDTDIFSPTIQFIENFSGIRYKGSYTREDKSDMAMRVIADHIRAIVFAIADGSIPSNTGPGYVIRRILRRAVRYYYSYLNIKDPFLFRLVPILVEGMSEAFPELISQGELITKVIHEEEHSFLHTLEAGLKRFETLQVSNKQLSGKDAFELYDTYGFPIDLTVLIAREKDWEVDISAYQQALNQQKDRSRADAKKEYSDWHILNDGETTFVGYDQSSLLEVRVLRWREFTAKGNKNYHLVLDKTPFYAEGGGQVGDTGILQAGEETLQILNTVKENDLILHVVDRLPATLDRSMSCEINMMRRSLIECNHSATHLLHAALREVLGTHVTQKGSLVNDNYLRFDFSHFQKVQPDELKKIEQIVNQKIRQNVPRIEDRSIPIEIAKTKGAMMLFGEKYGENVRMITFDSTFSRELCGGCHVPSTAVIGMLKIVSESAVAAGIRRIEALTAVGAENYVLDQEQLLEQIKEKLNHPRDIVNSIIHLQEENKSLQKTILEWKEKDAQQLYQNLLPQAVRVKGIQTLAVQVNLDDSKIAKNLIFQLGKQLSPCILLLAYQTDEKPQLMCYVSEDIAGLYPAPQLLKKVTSHIEGGGGGQAFFATAGGKKLSGLPAAIQAAHEVIPQLLNS